MRTFALQMLEQAARIKALRGRKRQQPIADHVGVTLRAYQQWEAGGGIAWPHLERLAAYHGVSPNYIEYGDETTTPQPAEQLDRIEAKLDTLLERRREP